MRHSHAFWRDYATYYEFEFEIHKSQLFILQQIPKFYKFVCPRTV